MSEAERNLREALRTSMDINGDVRSPDAKKGARHMAIKYDPTINLGHVLTFVGFMVTGLTAYSVLEKRVSLLEERSVQAVQTATDRTAEQRDTIREIKMDVKDVQRAVNELARALKK